MTQRDAAAQTGVSVARISRIEHGEGATALDVTARYVEALGGGWTWSRTSTTTPRACRPATWMARWCSRRRTVTPMEP
ncbi:helix-turn-helix domain-containing protein [Streptomyces roseolilacinus]|uniref:helix-turn-helix domain-containing protein n=1 Tax=Streptomyces roseolilacinus TaxID=66904 RepID=UPI001E322BAB|nr:helix-turn-helix transcriptional regulator [Streptomyces roseolilacinus]